MQSHQDHLDHLQAAGLAFTHPKRGRKAPLTKGWQRERHDAASTAAHVARGGNAGVHLGQQPDGTYLYAFDADYEAKTAELLRIAPELRDSLTSWRTGGSSKAFFRTTEPITEKQQTPDLDGPHTKLEILISGHAVIHGQHPDGDLYRCSWKQPISLTLGHVRQIWEQWTGQPWQEEAPRPPRQAESAGATRETRPAPESADLTALKAYWTPLEVFRHFGRADQGEQSEGNEIRLLGNGGLLIRHDGVWSIPARPGVGGDSISAWAFCRGLDYRRDFATVLDEMADAAGLARPERTAPVGETYDQARRFRAWTQSAGAVTEIRRRTIDAGMSTRSVLGMHRTLQALAELGTQRATFRILGASARKLAEMTAQSHPAAAAQLDRLAALGFISRTDAGIVEIVQVAESYHHSATDASGNFPQPGSLAATLGDDFFAQGPSLTAAAARRTSPVDLLRSAGPAARHVWAALQDGHQANAREIADLTGLTPCAVRGAATRLVELGLASTATGAHGRRLYTLTANAAARLDAIRPRTTTYGSTQRRTALHAGERAHHLQILLKSAPVNEIARLKMMIQREEQRAAAIRTWLDSAGIKPAKGFDFDLARFERQRTRDQRDQRAHVADFARQTADLDTREATRLGSIAGYTRAEVSRERLHMEKISR